MAVLVTGGSGFIGLNIVEALLAKGERVVSLADGPLPDIADGAFRGLRGTLRHVVGDVRSADTVRRLFDEEPIERVLHAAAVSPAPEREAGMPRHVIEVNLMGLVNLVTAARDRGVARIVFVGTGGVYGRTGAEVRELDEDTPCRPASLYGISKYAAEQTLERLASVHGLDAVTGRIGWAFGTWEWETGWRDSLSPIHQATRMARAGRAARLPRPNVQDWLYGRDVGQAFIPLLFADAPKHRLYTLGPGRSWSVADWCRRLADRHPGFTWSVGEEGAGEPLHIRLPSDDPPMSNARFAAEFGPVARYDLDRAFEDYSAWLDRVEA